MNKKSLANLRPAQPGDRIAAKPPEKVKSKYIHAKVTPAEHAEFKNAARLDGSGLSEWIRELARERVNALKG